jgi:hypothetical protein
MRGTLEQFGSKDEMPQTAKSGGLRYIMFIARARRYKHSLAP